MLENLTAYLEGRTGLELLRELVDVVIVYYVFYRLLLVARGTRAIQIAAGLGIISLLYVIAQSLELVTIVTLVGALLQSMILVVVVVFQNDIRRALQRVGSRAFFGGARAQETEVIEQVVEAARELARHRIGAIIAFEQDANLDEFVGQNKGIQIDAKVSAELLVSLFIPEGSNKLHDGAIVLRNLRIAKAGVFFPMPESRNFDSSFGSRHRAALGITEETDAVVVVVSEERGTISFCFNGNIAPDLQAHQLREMLFSIMSPKARQTEPSTKAERESIDRVSIRSQEPEFHDAPPPSTRHPALAKQAALTKHPGLAKQVAQQTGLSQASQHSTLSKDERHASSAPKPLRKSALPEKPPESVSESEHMPAAKPRPMPKASELERSPDSRGPDSDDPNSSGRLTPS